MEKKTTEIAALKAFASKHGLDYEESYTDQDETPVKHACIGEYDFLYACLKDGAICINTTEQGFIPVSVSQLATSTIDEEEGNVTLA
jgi:hypothetical protein